MSFYGTSMIFDGVACEEMGLVLYDFDNCRQDTTKFTSSLAIQEDRIDGRYRSLFYGGTVNEPLVFKMVLCAREDRAQRGEPFDRWDLQKIASWLTGHAEYKWLSVVQGDLENIRFRCICSELEAVEVAGNAWGVTCKVTCDSPFAYQLPQTYSFTVSAADTENPGNPGSSSTQEFTLFSESSYNGFYYPKLTISDHTGGDLAITVSNTTESSTFKLKGVASTVGQLIIDCENDVITAEDGTNAYAYVEFNSGFHFPRFARGTNRITLSGSATYTFECEWPVNVGG